MTFNVPIVKDDNYSIEFFYFFAEHIENIAKEYGKWPDKVTFIGKLGNELLSIIEDKKWDFDRFNITYEDSILNKIVIEYSKPLDEIEDRGYINGDNLSDKTMEGIPGNETMDKLINYSINTQFRIERKINPKISIKLIRS